MLIYDHVLTLDVFGGIGQIRTAYHTYAKGDGGSL
jgi:hypothetical protein